jgi:hypothetical protein
LDLDSSVVFEAEVGAGPGHQGLTPSVGGWHPLLFYGRHLSNFELMKHALPGFWVVLDCGQVGKALEIEFTLWGGFVVTVEAMVLKEW